MMTDRNRGPAASVLFLAIALALPSCGEPAKIPPADVARAAIETSLTAWRDGKKPADLAASDPPIQAVDTEWADGRKLASFEILRPEPSETDKRFVVKLAYPAPAVAAEVVYVVIGSSPVAVFREEDFTRTMNMENNPTTKVKKKR